MPREKPPPNRVSSEGVLRPSSATAPSATSLRRLRMTASPLRRYCFFHVGRDVEVAFVHLVDLFHLRVVERRVVGGGGELGDLLLVVDVWKRRHDRRVRVEPEQ